MDDPVAMFSPSGGGLGANPNSSAQPRAPDMPNEQQDMGDTIVVQPRTQQMALAATKNCHKSVTNHETPSSTLNIKEPRTYSEAVGDRVYGKQWEAAIHDELGSLNANGTWRLEDLPYGRKAITSKWIFKVKKHPDGSLDRFKARIVTRGFTQRYGIDYTETFAPTVRLDSI